MSYATFWKRTAAYLIDFIIYGIASSFIGNIVGLLVGIGMGVSAVGQQSEPPLSALFVMIGIGVCVQIVCYIAYYVWPESSSWQATIGKKILGLKVTDLQGQRISFMRSLWRNIAMIVSTLILCIGYLMCFWTEKKQCLHDSLANCLVIDTNPDQKQGCVISMVIGFFVLLFGTLIVGILAAIALPQYTRAVERSRAAEATVLTAKALKQQQTFYLTHGRYASRWNQLPAFDTCATQNSKLCPVANFTLELEEQGIAAQRNHGNLNYRLFRAYDPNDKRRSLVCISKNEMDKQYCNAILQGLSPRS